MTLSFRSPASCVLVCLLATLPSSANAQRRGGDPEPIPPIALRAGTADAVVKGAPYSADAITTQTQILGDGTRIERAVTAKVYRDGMGRLRREQTVLGLASLAPAADGQRVITIMDPVERVTITLDERTRTARRLPGIGLQLTSPGAGLQLNNGAVFYFRQNDGKSGAFATRRLERATPFTDDSLLLGDAADALRQLNDRLNRTAAEAQGRGGRGAAGARDRSVVTQLGTRQMEGLTVTGRRMTETIPTGEIGNDRPIEIVDEVWESSQLQVVVSLRHSDPRTGTLEYRLASVVLGEPPADLFTVPPGYTLNDAAPRPPVAAPVPPGARGGGGRGGRSGGPQ